MNTVCNGADGVVASAPVSPPGVALSEGEAVGSIAKSWGLMLSGALDLQLSTCFSDCLVTAAILQLLMGD